MKQPHPADDGAGSTSIIFREWRRLATGLCFATFMIGAFLFRLTAFPFYRILPIAKTRRQDLALALVHRWFNRFMRYMRAMKVIRHFEIRGLEQLDTEKPLLFVANHPTLIDVVAIMGSIPRCNCIVKRALWRHFFMGSVMRATGFIPNDHPRQLLEDCERSFASGRSLVIFPEGTRSPEHGLREFNRGAVRIAIRTGIPLVPIIVTCDPPTLMKHQPWYNVPARPVRLLLEVQKPMEWPAELLAKTSVPARVRALNHYLESWYHEQLGMSSPTPANVPEEPMDPSTDR